MGWEPKNGGGYQWVDKETDQIKSIVVTDEIKRLQLITKKDNIFSNEKDSFISNGFFIKKTISKTGRNNRYYYYSIKCLRCSSIYIRQYTQLKKRCLECRKNEVETSKNGRIIFRFIKYKKNIKNINEWAKILNISRQRCHQLYKSNSLLERIEKFYVAKK